MDDTALYPILDTVNSTQQVKNLSEDTLTTLASELRHYLIQQLSQTGGHLASNLGTIELTLALHYVYNLPIDQIVWDVGHQSYIHKILTERKHLMPSLRQKGGLAGFPKMSESPFDSFGTGHSSTSISAALGIALANKHLNKPGKAIAVIGDGAMTAGMAFEALNHAGDLKANMLVILNDNDMSISPNVGGLSKYLAKILSSKLYINMREGGKKALNHLPPSMGEFAKRTEEHMKGMVIPGTLFEELGFQYFGPVDGHDIHEIIRSLRNLKDLTGPRILHIVTQKGKGYKLAEQNPAKYHGVSSFDINTGKAPPSAPKPITYTQVFSQWLCDMAAADSTLVGINPAMSEGSGLIEFQAQYPDRFYDVAIAEQHAVTLAAGFAASGIKPVVAIYSTFLQRAYDQLIHDVAIQNLPVLFAIDRAGIVGADGPTHAGHFDISFLRCIPNLVVMTPSNENDCRKMLTTGHQHPGPAAVRYPRGSGPATPISIDLDPIEIGKGKMLRQGKRIALLAFGAPTQAALEVANNIDATIVDMRFVKPLDETLITTLSHQHEALITVEENTIQGGAGSAVNEFLTSMQINIPTLNLGIPDTFIDHASQAEIRSLAGLDAKGIRQSIHHFINHSSC
ncbi:MAG: 1-deoxy-D-xylulose-5-phosphate synthase, partial [Methylococcales bacterium]|nr:1-deoxy-D-xylulose-5-phosphate synthase [Methylococcales bacterium]